MQNTAFVLSPELADKVEKIKKELGVDNTAIVLSKALELLDLAMGRTLVLQSKNSNKKFQIDDLEEYHQTYSLDD